MIYLFYCELGTLSIAMILASQSLPLVAQHRLEALPLPVLATLLMSTIASTFKQGTFLSSVSASVTFSPGNQVHISVWTSPLNVAQSDIDVALLPLSLNPPFYVFFTSDKYNCLDHQAHSESPVHFAGLTSSSLKNRQPVHRFRLTRGCTRNGKDN